MKIFLIAFIISQIVLAIQIGINIQQSLRLNEMQKELNCLYRDMVYAGGDFCSKRPISPVIINQ